LQHGSQPDEASAAATAEMEAAFAERVEYMAALDSQYQRGLQTVLKLERTAASENDILFKVAKFANNPIDST
jgi:hypothetical protein